MFMFLVVIGALGSQLRAQTTQTETSQDSKSKHVQVAPETLWDPVWITKAAIGSQFLLSPYDPNIEPSPGQVIPGQRFKSGSD